MSRCIGRTKPLRVIDDDGLAYYERPRCSFRATLGSRYCWQHADQEGRELPSITCARCEASANADGHEVEWMRQHRCPGGEGAR